MDALWGSISGGITGAVVGGLTAWLVALDARRRDRRDRLAGEWEAYLEGLASALFYFEHVLGRITSAQADGSTSDELDVLREARHAATSKIKGGYIRFHDDRGDVLIELRGILERIGLDPVSESVAKALTRLVSRWGMGHLPLEGVFTESRKLRAMLEGVA